MQGPASQTITQLLGAIHSGRANAVDARLPWAYSERKSIPAALFASEPPGDTLQPTAPIHEAWIRLAGQLRTREDELTNRGHFFDSLERLAQLNERRGESHILGSLTIAETAAELDDSHAAVERNCLTMRGWLRPKLGRGS